MPDNINPDSILPNPVEAELKKSVKSTSRINKKQAIWVSFLMNIFTLGVWSRFRPRRGGWNGTWGLTVLFLLIAVSGLIGERFFKEKINSELKTALNVDQNILPEQWEFEELNVANDKEITGLKEQVASLLKELVEARELSADLKKPQNANNDTGRENDLNEQIISLNKQLNDAENKIIEITANPPVQMYVDTQTNLPPKIKLQKFKSVDSVIGCSSRFSDERKADVFKDDYKDFWMQWTGEIQHIDKQSVSIRLDENSILNATLVKEGAGYDLLKGDPLTLTFKLTEMGNCDLPYLGSNAFIVK